MSAVVESNGAAVKKVKGKREKKAEAKKPIAMPKPQWLDLNEITFDEAYQMRENIPSSAEYSEILKACPDDHWPFVPLVVAKIGAKLFMIEGFTRSRATMDAGKGKVFAHVVECTKAEAMRLAMGANSDHGFRRTNADKRKVVRTAIAMWPGFTATKIADVCKVSHTYVYNVIESLKGAKIEPSEADGEPKAVAAESAAPVESKAKESEPEYEDFGDEGVAAVVESAPAVDVSPVDLLAQRIEKARADAGRLVRSLEEIGLLEKCEKQLASILEAISKKSKANK